MFVSVCLFQTHIHAEEIVEPTTPISQETQQPVEESEDTMVTEPEVLKTQDAVGNDLSDSHITKVEFTNTDTADAASVTNAYNRNKVYLHVEFDDKAGRINEGDYIEVTWPTTGDVSVNSTKFTDQVFKLKNNNGEEVDGGLFTVTNGSAKVTFTSAAQDLQEVSGGFYLGVENILAPGIYSSRDIQYYYGSKMVVLTVRPIESGGGVANFNKYGKQGTEIETKINWILTLNGNQESGYETDYVVRDTLPDGLQFSPDGFKVAINSRADRSDVQAALNELGSDNGRYATYRVDYENRTIEVIVPAKVMDGNKIDFKFSTDIIEGSVLKTSYTNQAQYDYTISNKTFSGEKGHRAEMKYSRAYMIGLDKGVLQIVKYAQGTTTPVKGVHFTIVNEKGQYLQGDGSYNETAYEFVTDDNGIIEVQSMVLGSYTITEVSLEESAQWTVMGTDTQKTATFTLEDAQGQQLIFYNEIAKTNVEVQKIWDDEKDKDGIRPQSIQVQLLADGEAVEQMVVTLNEENGWTASFTDLVAYTEKGEAIVYTVQEVDVPNGYTVSYDESGYIITNTHVPSNQPQPQPKPQSKPQPKAEPKPTPEPVKKEEKKAVTPSKGNGVVTSTSTNGFMFIMMTLLSMVAMKRLRKWIV